MVSIDTFVQLFRLPSFCVIANVHQPGQDVFKSVLPEDINWKPFAAFPPPVRLAVIVGQPSEAPTRSGSEYFASVKLMPHRHPFVVLSHNRRRPVISA